MRRFLKVAAFVALTGVTSPALAEVLQGILVKAESCTCCEGHARYLLARQIHLEIRAVEDLAPMRAEAGMLAAYEGCHLIFLDGYVFEGHISYELIRKVLDERPTDVVGLTLPGMPTGVPGMGGPKTGPYEVLAVHLDGTTTVYGLQ